MDNKVLRWQIIETEDVSVSKKIEHIPFRIFSTPDAVLQTCIDENRLSTVMLPLFYFDDGPVCSSSWF